CTEWRGHDFAIVGTGQNWSLEVVCAVACRPFARQIRNPPVGGEFGRPDNVYLHHIKSATAGPQRIIIEGQQTRGVGWTIVPDNMDIVLVGLVVVVNKSRVGPRVIILGLPDNVRRAAAPTAAAGFEKRTCHAAGQTKGNGTFEECATSDTPGAYLDNNFVEGFTLFRNHVEPPLEQ